MLHQNVDIPTNMKAFKNCKISIKIKLLFLGFQQMIFSIKNLEAMKILKNSVKQIMVLHFQCLKKLPQKAKNKVQYING